MDNGNKVWSLMHAIDRLVGKALGDDNYEGIYGDLCNALAESGLPLLRAQLSMQTLHPLVSSVDITWLRGRDIEVNLRPHTSSPTESWLRSPLYWMLTNRRPELRSDLREDNVVRMFPLFEELRSLGATDYLALLTPFGEAECAFERRDGILTSWTSDAPGGFGERHVGALRALQPYLGLVAKLAKHDHTARNVVSAYLGNDAGRRVLEGRIRLGDVEHIPAVIWFSDLRDSTAMAERMPAEAFLRAVNGYFDCTAGAVLEHGGEVLRFIGDAVLAVFPVPANASPTGAAERALEAARAARQRMRALNELRAGRSLEQLTFGLGLHAGELLFGNIGVPTRLEFSVIGRAANEASRLEALTKSLGEPVLVSRAFAEAVQLQWRSLGTHGMKGVGQGMEVFAPPRGT